METIYQRLLWLDIGQAIAYLKTLTTAPVTERLLLQLCELGDCTAYIDATGLEGIALCNELTRVSGWRHQEIISPSFFETGGEEGLAPRFVKGSYSLRPLPGQGEEDGFGLWEIGMYPPEAPIAKALLRFKPADIQALAVKTNKATEPYSSSASELESLLQQLEDERNRREAAEIEAAALRQQLATGMTTQQGAGLYFPYATKELEAMRAAALKFWQSSKLDHLPLQKQVQQFIAEHAGGMPERKAKELAHIIKPEHYRDI